MLTVATLLFTLLTRGCCLLTILNNIILYHMFFFGMVSYECWNLGAGGVRSLSTSEGAQPSHSRFGSNSPHQYRSDRNTNINYVLIDYVRRAKSLIFQHRRHPPQLSRVLVCPMNGWLQTNVKNVSHRPIWTACFSFFFLQQFPETLSLARFLFSYNRLAQATSVISVACLRLRRSGGPLPSCFPPVIREPGTIA